MKSALYAVAGAVVAMVAMASIQARTSLAPGPTEQAAPLPAPTAWTAPGTPGALVTSPLGAPAVPRLVTLQQPRVLPAAYDEPAPAPRRIVRRERAPRRNWAKTAMIIGGSAGAGAGVGGIAGGKKGALVGAAIGGGAATLYEALKKAN